MAGKEVNFPSLYGRANAREKGGGGSVTVTQDREMATEGVTISTGYHALCDPATSKASVLSILRKER